MHRFYISAEQKLQALLAQHNLSDEWQKKVAFIPLVQAVASSDFLFDTLQKQPVLLSEWLENPPCLSACSNYAGRLSRLVDRVEREGDLHSVLRRFRHQELACLSYVQTHFPEQAQAVFECLSDLAESLILCARDWLFRQFCQLYGTPVNELGEVQELIILGMGKLGGRELNFSSDIDLIFTYPEQGETTGGRKPLENSKFFIRLGQRLIQALDEVNAEGFVYRTDMRLRPFGDSGALVLSFAAMEDYYQEQGRDWERYAMIKAKILGEDLANPNHKYLKSLLRPFVYRRYLDFSAIQSLREMKSKISREVLRRGLDDNIKLGAGGIREVEFIVQAFQLMRGGRDKILQQRSLLTVLPHLAKLNLLTECEVRQLREAYLFLRHTENVLQAIADKQTQTLPSDEREQWILVEAVRCYFGRDTSVDWQGFLSVLHTHQANVRAIFNALIGEEEEESEGESGKLAQWQDILHYQISEAELVTNLQDYAVNKQDYTAIFQLFANTFQEWVKRPIGVRGRTVLRKLMPIIADSIFQRADYLALLPRILNIVDKITMRTTYLELLLEHEQILPKLFDLCGRSTMIATQIARYPMLLDELIGQNSLTNVVALADYPQALHEYLLRIPEDDEEALIDGLRQFKQSQLLRIAAADILGVLPVMKISDHLTYLAEAILGAVVNLAWKSVVQRFGEPEHLAEGERDFVVIGYGKLGGIELGYNSDLDLVFLHNAPEQSETVGGKKSISAHQFYLKLAQKINGMFSLNTAAGVLYEVDMRLRPSGEAGLLVSTFAAYEHYQHHEAWTWENQALVRARAVYGSRHLCEKFDEIRRAVLAKPRTSGQLATEICKMREKMYVHLANEEPQWFHLKKDRGGITDIEFIAQFLVLNYACQAPEMARWSDNVRIFETAVASAVLQEEDGAKLKQIYTDFRHQIHHLNLIEQESRISVRECVAEREFIVKMWENLLLCQNEGKVE